VIAEIKNECVFTMLLACSVFCSGCSTEQIAAPSVVEQKMPVIVVTSFPLYVMVTEIGGDAVVVEWLSQSAVSPQDWVPSGDDIQRLQSADLILLNGAGYEPWTQNLSLPRSRTIDTTTATVGLAGYADQLLSIDGKVTHQHGPQGSQSEAAIAAATWLDPQLAIAQLNRVELEIVKIVPDRRDQIAVRATALRQQLLQIDVRLKALKLNAGQLLADSSDVAYLVSALKWEFHLLESAADDPAVDFSSAIETLEPRLLVFRENAPAEIRKLFVQSAVPAVAIDVCDKSDDEQSFVDRLTGNIDRLETAMANAGLLKLR